MSDRPILVDLADLDQLPPPLQFVDTRTGPDYRRGHIPGAIHLDTFPYANERTDEEGWGTAVADWRAVFAQAGITADATVVFYDGGLENRAARNGFMLRYLGHPRAHVLHGGMTAWVRAARPRERTAPAPVAVASTLARFTGGLAASADPLAARAVPAGTQPRGEMVALVDDVARAVAERASLLLDVRDAPEYQGRVRLQWNPRMGRIPRAVPLEWTSILVAEAVEKTFAGTPYYKHGMLVGLRSDADIIAALASAGLGPDTDVIVYCQKSHRACTVYLALERLGFSRARVYPGSFREWSRRSDLPVER